MATVNQPKPKAVPQTQIIRFIRNRAITGASSTVTEDLETSGVLKGLRVRFQATGAASVTATQIHDAITRIQILVGGSAVALDSRGSALRGIDAYNRGKVGTLRGATAATLNHNNIEIDFGFGPNDLEHGIPLGELDSAQLAISLGDVTSPGVLVTPILNVELVKFIANEPANPTWRQYAERRNDTAGTTDVEHRLLVGADEVLRAIYINYSAYDATALLEAYINGSDLRFQTRLGEAIANSVDNLAGYDSTTGTQTALEMWPAGGALTAVGEESAARLRWVIPGNVFPMGTGVIKSMRMTATRPTSSSIRWTEERLVKRASTGGVVGAAAAG